MQVTYSHIKQLKRVAKDLKHAYPLLKLGQRQDKAAVLELGVRSYHEALRLYDHWLMRHVHLSPDLDGFSRCSFCEFSFDASLKEDRESHREIHERFHEASEALGYTPATHSNRERMKREGRKQALSSGDLEARLEGLVLLVRGWFDRSLSKAIYGGYWRKHPTFDSYVSMIEDKLSVEYAELNTALRTQYRCDPGKIAAGDTNWYPSVH